LFNRLKLYLYALFVEHSILNIFWKNFHKVDEGVYRSAQMNPYTLKKIIKRYKIKTIISFRRDSDTSPLTVLEREVCKQMNVKFKHISLSSRSLPSAEKLMELKKEFEKMQKPVLLHCKAGADRTSLASLLYLYWTKKDLRKYLKRELSFWKVGHIKSSKAGIIDFYFSEFMKSGEKDIIEWSRKYRNILQKKFKPKGFWSFINDKILRRE
jgi:protein tyrosine/serine phosphatase